MPKTNKRTTQKKPQKNTVKLNNKKKEDTINEEKFEEEIIENEIFKERENKLTDTPEENTQHEQLNANNQKIEIKNEESEESETTQNEINQKQIPSSNSSESTDTSLPQKQIPLLTYKKLLKKVKEVIATLICWNNLAIGTSDLPAIQNLLKSLVTMGEEHFDCKTDDKISAPLTPQPFDLMKDGAPPGARLCTDYFAAQPELNQIFKKEANHTSSTYAYKPIQEFLIKLAQVLDKKYSNTDSQSSIDYFSNLVNTDPAHFLFFICQIDFPDLLKKDEAFNKEIIVTVLHLLIQKLKEKKNTNEAEKYGKYEELGTRHARLEDILANLIKNKTDCSFLDVLTRENEYTNKATITGIQTIQEREDSVGERLRAYSTVVSNFIFKYEIDTKVNGQNTTNTFRFLLLMYAFFENPNLLLRHSSVNLTLEDLPSSDSTLTATNKTSSTSSTSLPQQRPFKFN